jgi:hypothetical protein
MATQVPSSRLMRDYKLIVTQAAPNNTNNTTSYIDLGSGPFNPEEIEVEISVPAITAHTTANNLQIQLYSSASSTGAAITSPLIECDVVGVGGTGSVATVFRYKLPPGTLRYVAWHMIATTDDCSAATVTFSILT